MRATWCGLLLAAVLSTACGDELPTQPTDSPSSFAYWPPTIRGFAARRPTSVVAAAKTSLRRTPTSGFVASVCCVACSASAAGARRMRLDLRARFAGVAVGLAGPREVVRAVVMAISTYRGAARPSGARATPRRAQASLHRRFRSCSTASAGCDRHRDPRLPAGQRDCARVHLRVPV